MTSRFQQVKINAAEIFRYVAAAVVVIGFTYTAVVIALAVIIRAHQIVFS